VRWPAWGRRVAAPRLLRDGALVPSPSRHPSPPRREAGAMEREKGRERRGRYRLRPDGRQRMELLLCQRPHAVAQARRTEGGTSA
jgi:hypothetical protein